MQHKLCTQNVTVILTWRAFSKSTKRQPRRRGEIVSQTFLLFRNDALFQLYMNEEQVNIVL